MSSIALRQDDLPGVPEPTSMLAMIYRAARDPDIDVSKMSQMMEMAERMEKRQAEQAFDNAMMDAQEEMGPVRTDAGNKQTNSKYATYAALDRAIRPVYTKHGFSISYNTGESSASDMLRVLALVAHKAGGRRTYTIDMPADGKGAKGGDVMTRTHATGSAYSYGQRYLLKGIFNIIVSDHDDDGNAASGNGVVSDDQVSTLAELLDRFNADVPKFCQYFKINAVKDLPAKRYREAVEMLNHKGKQK